MFTVRLPAKKNGLPDGTVPYLIWFDLIFTWDIVPFYKLQMIIYLDIYLALLRTSSISKYLKLTSNEPITTLKHF